MNRALVISGGGNKGAWVGGLLQYLVEERHYDWNMYYGTSTGAMLITLTALQQMHKLHDLFTNINQKNIFSINPFKKNSKDINIFKAIIRLLRHKTSFGTSDKLSAYLYQYFTHDDYENIKLIGKHIYPCVTNYTTGHEEYIDNFNTTYEQYIKYVVAAASIPLAMNLIDINGNLFLDGSIAQYVPIQKAINAGADEVDVIIPRPEHIRMSKWQPKNVIDVFSRTLDIMDSQLSDYNIITAGLRAVDKPVKIRIRFAPFNLSDNNRGLAESLSFDKPLLSSWWNAGYAFGALHNQSKQIILMP